MFSPYDPGAMSGGAMSDEIGNNNKRFVRFLVGGLMVSHVNNNNKDFAGWMNDFLV